jgi:hypothetical protein
MSITSEAESDEVVKKITTISTARPETIWASGRLSRNRNSDTGTLSGSAVMNSDSAPSCAMSRSIAANPKVENQMIVKAVGSSSTPG